MTKKIAIPKNTNHSGNTLLPVCCNSFIAEISVVFQKKYNILCPTKQLNIFLGPTYLGNIM